MQAPVSDCCGYDRPRAPSAWPFAQISAGRSVKPNAFHLILFVRAATELAAVTHYLRKNIGDCFNKKEMDKALEWARRGNFWESRLG